MNELISICIPTYKRPDKLAIALESCVAQSYDTLEVVVGDDSPDERSTAVAEAFRSRRNWAFTYRRHSPSLGQSQNVAQLFALAHGGRIVLLHDDDVLLPEAISILAAPWSLHPSLAVTFGKQECISEDGSLDARKTQGWNEMFARTGAERLLESSLRAALLQQMPNDGYMISADEARKVGYWCDAESGGLGFTCDLDFSLRLAVALGPNRMYFIDQPVSQYRFSDVSVSTTSRTRKIENAMEVIAMHQNIESLRIPSSLQQEKRVLLTRLGDSLVKAYAITGRRRTALRLFMSDIYGWRRRLSAKGLYHVLLILDSRLDSLRRSVDSRLGIDFGAKH